MSILVPEFSLYGERQRETVREFLHVEEISARSAARNWQIDTHVHNGLLQLLFVFSGNARIRLDSEEQDYGAAFAVVIPEGVIHAFKFQPGTEGCVLTLDAAGLASASPDGSQMFSVLRGSAEVLALTRDDTAARVHGILDQIKAEFAHPGAGSTTLYVWLVRSLLLLLVRATLRQADAQPDEGMRETAEGFRQMIEQHYLDHWPVSSYARQLNLSESRLNRLCEKRFGRTAFALIQERLLLEAQRRLIYTGVPVSQLAYELGFSDPPYFCRFFKRLTGHSPGNFRGRNRQ